MDDDALLHGNCSEATFTWSTFAKDFLHFFILHIEAIFKHFMIVIKHIFKTNMVANGQLIVNIILEACMQESNGTTPSKINAVIYIHLIINQSSLILKALLQPQAYPLE